MPRIQIPNPEKRQWSGIFAGEDFGSIFSGRAIDLERFEGKIGLADSYSDIVNNSQVGFSNLTTPVGFVRSSADSTDRWWANAGKLFKTSGTNPESGWAQDGIANSPSAPLYDLIDFLGAIIVPTSTNLDRLSSGTWSNNWWSGLSGASALQSGVPHRFAILAAALLITDGRFINDYDGTIARDPALTLPAGFEASGIFTTREVAYIYGKNNGGGEVDVYVWDRISTNYLAKYPTGDTEVLVGFTIDAPYIITKKGMVKRFNGVGFETVAQFPTVEAQQQISAIHPNGVSVTENIAKIFVNFGTISNTRLSSGFWNYDATTRNLYQAGSIRNTSTKDYGQYELSEVGAIKQTIVGQGLYLVGGRPYTAYSGSTAYGIFTSDEDSSSNQGYFIMPKIRSTNVQRFWRMIYATMRRMTSADDRFRIAIRVEDSNDLPAYETITWTAANTFTASNSDIQAGDFVEVIAGDNGGALARILSYSGGTVTIDRSLYSSTSTSRVRYLRFTDLGTISNVQIQTEVFHSAVRGPWLQMLIEFRGSRQSPLLESMLIDYKDLNQVV